MNDHTGFNPMRWDCEKRSCFNKLHRPKIELFAECFPRKIAMTDIDATVEVAGSYLFVDFKSSNYIPVGQRLYFERLTKIDDRLTVIVVVCDAETMDCYEFCTIERGVMGGWAACNLSDLKQHFVQWSKLANERALKAVLKNLGQAS
jgi:hypothetical protein